MLHTEQKIRVNKKLMISTHIESEFWSTKPHTQTHTYFSTALQGWALVANLHRLVSIILSESHRINFQCNL